MSLKERVQLDFFFHMMPRGTEIESLEGKKKIQDQILWVSYLLMGSGWRGGATPGRNHI